LKYDHFCVLASKVQKVINPYNYLIGKGKQNTCINEINQYKSWSSNASVSMGWEKLALKFKWSLPRFSKYPFNSLHPVFVNTKIT